MLLMAILIACRKHRLIADNESLLKKYDFEYYFLKALLVRHR